MEKVKLTKGGTVNLTKRYSGEKKFRIGLGWDLKGGRDADLDALVVELGANGKVIDIDHLVGYPSGDTGRSNYRNITFTTPDGKVGFKDPEDCVKHFGDARSALVSDADDEVIEIDLSRVNSGVNELLIIVSIYDSGISFKEVGFPSVSVYKGDSDISDLSYSLDESFPDCTVVEVAKIKKEGDSWVLEALGNGSEGLDAELQKYGIPC